jgi:cytochrome c oxidase cbb3-type subunit 4
VSAHSTYEAMRHFADSWGLLVMAVTFVGLAAWPFRPNARSANDEAARIIFKDNDNG